MSVDFAVTGQQEMDVFTGGSIIMDIMNYGFVFWAEATVWS